MPCCLFLHGIWYIYLMWRKIKSHYLEKECQYSFNPRSMTLHKNLSLKKNEHSKKPIINK